MAKQDTAFCNECQKEVIINEEPKEEFESINGVNIYTYFITRVCSECNSTNLTEGLNYVYN